MKLLRKVLEYALVICIILEFNTVYTAVPIIKFIVQIIPVPILLLLIFMRHQYLSKNMGFVIFAFLIGSIFPMLNLSTDAYIAYIKTFIVILPLLFIYLYQKKKSSYEDYLSLFFRYSNTMVVLATVSVIMWLLCSILQILPMTGMYPYNWGDKALFVPSYYNIYFETQGLNLFGEWTRRNDGIFNEGPMHNMALCVALTIEYFLRIKRSKKKIAILVIAIITSFTTTGQMFLIALLAWHLFNNTIISKYRFLIIFSVPILIYGVYTLANMSMKFKEEASGDNSVNYRSADIENCIDAGLANPILGVGIIQKGDITLWKGQKLGQSNSLFAVFACGGIYMLLLYLGAILIIPMIYFKKFGYRNWLLTMIFFLGLFTITVSFLRYLTLLFLAWGLSNLDFKRWNINRKQIS